ncbi:Cytochrome P450 [Penicillium cf. griseofulvum]|uniref:Cytochrome P450 n=1 Tax=Penicillium cf. griseofulvum TaxID=2972120 RepID=A0A9W9M5G7_9EURO|nr:Cytochrome P450 [Penicillium cf. griseofulvum]KAJ5435345.1 Cytochrome P450 [Penicillium cf. griseofulvum]KAJ5453176.1 Cytochrome P450 [Penicillium cf. griseofulvum]
MIEDLLAVTTLSRASLWALGLFVAFCVFRKFQASAQIARLGVRAPKIKFRLPYALDFIFQGYQANKEYKDLEFWDAQIMHAGGLTNAKTAELDAGISTRMILTKDPENIKAVLTGQFADYGKGESFHQEWKEFLGDSIFATDGELWSRSRQLIRPMFVRDRIVDTEIFEKHVQKLIPLLGGSDSPSSSKVVDVGSLFFRYTLDAATDYLLGKGTNSLDNPATRFAEAFRYVQQRQSEYFRFGAFRFVMSRTEFRKNLRIMDEFMQPYIQAVIARSASEPNEKLSKSETFLDALAGFTRDPHVLRDQLVAVLLAGRDTTAATLSFCLFELSRNPEVVAKLRDEIRDRLGVGANAQKPSYIDLKEMKYLNAVLNETMRVYPVVPFNVRNSLHDTTLPRGGGPDGRSPVGVRANSRIIYSTMLMQRDPDLYDGPESKNYFDPGKWIPERWVSGWHPKPWNFIPFNGGPRICIGQQFATIEMGYTVIRVLQAYERIIALPVGGKDKVEDPVLRFEVTLSPGSELNCVFLKEGEEGARSAAQSSAA